MRQTDVVAPCAHVYSDGGCASGSALMVILQEPTEPLPMLNGSLSWSFRDLRKQQDVALALVVALLMIMQNILMQSSSQGTRTEQNELG